MGIVVMRNGRRNLNLFFCFVGILFGASLLDLSINFGEFTLQIFVFPRNIAYGKTI
jgi:hypothetical protein